MYYNEKHKEIVENKEGNYSYVGSYRLKEVTIDSKNKKMNKTYIRVECPYCGKKYDVRLDHFKKGIRCSHCCNKYENSFAYYIQQELEESLNKYWDWERNNELGINPYCISKATSQLKIWIRCDKIKYHKSYDLTPAHFVRGDRCPYCSTRRGKVHPKDSFAQWGINTFGDDFLEKYWSEKNNELGIDPWKITHCSLKKIWIYCQEKNHHNDEGGYEITCDDFYNGKRCGYCGNKKVHPKDSFGALYPEKAKYWSKNNDISSFEVSPKSNDTYKFICEKCGEEFDRSLNNMNRWDTGVVCKKCNSSQGETRIIRWLNQNNIEYIHDKHYFNDLIGCGNGVLKPDFIIKDRKIWIEYDGEFHYKNIHNDDSLKKQQIHDNRKNKYAKDHNWKLIRIPYWEFDDIEEILEKELK